MATLRLLVNVNSVTSAFYNEGKLLNLIYAFKKANGDSNHLVGKFLKGVRVKLMHLKFSNGLHRTKTIWGLAPGYKTAGQHSFSWKREGKPDGQGTVCAYFKESRIYGPSIIAD